MDYSALTPDRVLRELASSADGLTAAEAHQRLGSYGPNVLPEQAKVPLWRRVIEPFSSLFVIVLLVAALISILTGHHLDAVVMTAVLMVNAVIYYSQQYSASRVLASLKSHDKRTVRALRTGEPVLVAADQLVPGDVVLLNEGLKVPADGRLLRANQLQIDESMLTGESEPQTKTLPPLQGGLPVYDQTNMVFSGTLVRSGIGEFIVTATGEQTELGHIAELSNSKFESGPLQRQIDRLAGKVVMIVGVILALVFPLALFRGIEPEAALRFLLSLAVSAIPEGLPVALTLVMLFSAQRLVRRRALVRRLSAVETLGQVQLVATDKTGTITHNQLKIAQYWPYQDDETAFRRIIRRSLSVQRGHSDDPLELLIRDSIPHLPTRGHDVVAAVPFEQAARMSGAIWKEGHQQTLYVKGAPEAILEASDLSRAQIKQIHEQAISPLSAEGYRLIAFGYRPTANDSARLTRVRGLNFAGLIALADGLRASVPGAVRTAHAAGIEVLMLTGDNPTTATTIGRSAGILAANEHAKPGTAIEGLSPEAIRAVVADSHAFARVLPEHKYAILDAYHGRLVTAMTGDGVNDVPALVKADVGIAVGRGSDAAKEAADIIILNNNFATIIEAIRQGRAILANLRKMLMYLFATSMGEVATMIAALVIGLPLPVTAVQILWVNIVTDGFAVIPLGLEPPESGQMKTPPQGANAPLLTRRQIVRVALSALTLMALVLLVFAFYRWHNPGIAGTMAFTVLVVIQWANALVMRNEHGSLLDTFRRPNWLLYGGLAIGAVLQGLLLFTPLRQVFEAVSIGLADVGVLVLVFAAALILGEAFRRFTITRLSEAQDQNSLQ